MTTDTQPLAPTDAEIATLIDKEMREYSIGAYADHGSAKNQLEHFARAVLAKWGAQLVAREPLSEAKREEIIEAVDWYNFPRDVIDAVERAHGIKGGQHVGNVD